jgi:hypothetical protein
MSGFKQSGISLDNRSVPPTPDPNTSLIYSDGSRLKVVGNAAGFIAYTSDVISGGSGFTPIGTNSINITPIESNYSFAVNDYIGATSVASISAGLNSRINNINIVAGTNITVNKTFDNVYTISSVGGSGGGGGSLAVKVGGTTISNVTTLELSGSGMAIGLINNGNGYVTATLQITGSIDQGTITTTTTYITGNSFTPNDTSTAYSYTLNGNSTIYCPTNMTDGSTKVVRFVQPQSANYTISFSNNAPYVWKFSNGSAPTLTNSNGAIDVLTILRVQNDIYVTIIKNFTV